MELKSILKTLEKNSEYIGWKKINPDSFFSYALKTMDDHSEQPWHLGFYNKKSDKMITFLVSQDGLSIQPEEAVFKEPNAKISQIDESKLEQDLNSIMHAVEAVLKENYRGELITKRIFILQNLPEFGTVWNVTLLSKAMNAINIKIGPENGQVLSHKMDNLMQFMKRE